MSRTEQVKKVKNAEPDKKILFHRSFLNIYYISDPVLIRLNTLSGQREVVHRRDELSPFGYGEYETQGYIQ